MFGINLLSFFIFILAYNFILVIKMKGRYINVAGYHEFYSTAYHWFFMKEKGNKKINRTFPEQVYKGICQTTKRTSIFLAFFFFSRKNTIPIFQDF